MVAVVTGNGLGINNSSLRTIGDAGLVGSASSGRGGEQVFVNAATGNLVLRRSDDFLLTLGADFGLVNTYNSQGVLTYDNTDSWQLSAHKRVRNLTGTVNTAGSTVTRADGDGSEQLYTYDTARGLYVSNDGQGAYDTLSYSTGTTKWTWTNGDAGASEIYAATGTNNGRLEESRNPDGNVITYLYDGSNRLIEIRSNAVTGDSLFIDYAASTNNVSQVRAVVKQADGTTVTVTRVRYTYDASNRLATIQTDLSPNDNSVADGRTYTTTFTYNANGLVSNISETDGSSLAFTYVSVGTPATWHVQSVTDALGRVTQFSYNTATLTTTVTDGLGNQTLLTYDSANRLTTVKAPTVGGVTPTTTFAYNTNGDVTSITDARNNTTVFQYDTRGNLTLKRDALGNTVTRIYDTTGTRNLLLSETLYTTPDPDGAGAATASGPLVTRYVYDTNLHLRFVVSAEGVVQEYRYDAYGNRTSALRYPTTQYDVSALAATATLTEAQLTTWLTTATKSDAQRVDYQYDLRGQLKKSTAYASVDSTGNGVLDGKQSVTQYVYDYFGSLLQRIDPNGNTTVFTYDGLGRVLSSVMTPAGGGTTITTTYSYDDAGNLTTITSANGLVTTNLYNKDGELLSVTQTGPGAVALGTTSYAYDAGGHLRMQTSPTGQRQYFDYDADGRMTSTVDADGTFTDHVYNRDNQLIKTTTYATRVASGPLATLVDAGGNRTAVTLASLRPVSSATDQLARYVYDAAGQRLYTLTNATLNQTNDNTKYAVTKAVYDGAGRLVSTVAYANLYTVAGTVDEVLVSDITTVTLVPDAANDRTTRNLYDNAGRLVGTLDAQGYLVEYLYDNADRLTKTIAYANVTNSAYWASGTLANLRPATQANDITTRRFYDGQGRLIGELDGEGYLSERTYDTNGNVATEVRYSVALTYVEGVSTFASLKSTAAASPSHTTTYAYDAFNRVLQQTTFEGVITKNTYDSVGNLTDSTGAFGTAEARTVQRRYDALGRVVAELTPRGAALITGGMTQPQIDAIWNQYGVRYVYDLSGNLIKKVTPDGSGTTGNTTWYYYDADSRLTDTVNALGEVERLAYDAFGRVSSRTRYATRLASTAGLTGGYGSVSVTANAAADTVTAYTYYISGRLATESTAEGGLITHQYNAFGQENVRLTKVDAGRTLRQELDYNTRGLLTQTRDDPSGIAVTQTRSYDAFGRQTSLADGRGNTWTTTYDRLGRTIQLNNPLSQSRWTTYDAYARVLSTAEYTSGNKTNYSYNDAAKSVTITTPELFTLTTFHNSFGQTASITDANGNVTNYVYDKDGNLLSSSDSLGTLGSNTYDSASRLATTTDANGVTTTITYDAVNRVFTRTVDSAGGGLALITTYGYDAQGRQITVTAPDGTVTQTDYDRDGRVKAITVDPSGLALKTTFAYDNANHLITVTDGAGTPTGGDTTSARVTSYQYDVLGRRTSVTESDSGTTTYVYDKNDNVVARTDPRDASYVTRYVYDAANQLVYAVDALGGVTETSYDAAGRVIAVKRYANAISLTGLGNAITASDVTSRRTLDSTRDRLRQTVYDLDGRDVFTIDNLSSTEAVVAKRVYDSAGNVVRTISYASTIAVGTYTTVASVPVSATPTAADRELRYVHDARHRVTYTVDGFGAVSQTKYDGVGNVVQTTAYAALYSASTIPSLAEMTTWITTNASSANDRVTTYWYDAIGRQVYMLNAERYIVRTSYNDVSRTESRTAHAVGIPVGTSLTPSSTLAQVAAAITAAGQDQTTVTTRDRAGRITQVTDALGQSDTYGYDRVGNRISFTNKKGATWNYTYDANHRLLTEVSPQVDVTAVTGADSAASLTVTTTTGVRVTTRMTYDALGNVLTRTEAFGSADARTTSYEYDKLGRQTKVTLPAVNVYSAASDSVTRVGTAVVRTESAYTPYSQVTYDALGNAVVNRDIAGNYSYRIYDQLGRVRYEIDTEKYVTGHQYDRFGNETTTVRYAGQYVGTLSGTPINLADVTAVTLPTSAANDRTITQTYDRLNRLATVQMPAVLVFDPNAGSTAGGTSYTAGAKTVYTYNAFGQVVISAQRATGTSTETYANTYFYYDRLGQRVATVDPMKYVTTYTYDANGNVWTESQYAKPITIGQGGWVAPTSTSPGSVGTPVQTPSSGGTNDPAGYDRIHTRIYDKLNRLVWESVDGTASTVANGVATRTSSSTSTSYAYDAVGNRTTTTDIYGGVTYTYYDALGRIWAVTDVSRNRGDGTTIIPLTEFLRNARGDLVQTIKYAESATSVSTSGYTRTVSPQGIDQKVSLLLDAQGRVLRSEDANGADRFVSYTSRGDVAKEWQIVASLNDVAGTYDALVTVHEYDKLGRETAVVEPQTLPRDVNDTTPTVVVRTETTYNAFGEQTSRLVRENSQSGVNAQVTNSYDQAGRLWRSNADGITRVYLYNQLGQVTAEIHSKDLDLSTYSDAATVEAFTTQRMRTETVYDLDGRTVTQRLPTFVSTDITDALDTTLGLGTMSKGSNPDAGYLQTIGLVWSPSVGGRLRDGTAATYTVTSGRYLYWADPANVVGESSTGGQIFEYRAVGNTTWLTLTIDRIFRSSDSARFLGVNVAGLTGNYEFRIRYSRDGGATTFAIRTGTMNNPANTSGTFSDTTSTNVGGTSTVAPVVNQTLDRWGNVLTYTDALGNTTAYRYNQYDQVIEKKLPTVTIKSVSASTGAITTSTAQPVQENHYDRLGRLIATKDANGYVNAVTLNAAGQIISETHADQTTGKSHTGSSLKSYVYDAFGNRTKDTDELGFVTAYSYDKNNQLTGTQRETALNAIANQTTANIVTENFAYDDAGRRITDSNGLGEVTRYWYDLQGHIRKRTTPRGYATTMVYDLYGNKSQETDAIGGTKTWTYDYAGRLLARTDLGGMSQANALATPTYVAGVSHTFLYGLAGEIKSHTSTVGLNVQYTYDEAGQLKLVNDTSNPTANSGGLVSTNQQSQITYDAMGRHIKERTTVNGVVHQNEVISYDAAGRLSAAWDLTGGAQYFYDAQGNRTEVLSSAIAANNISGNLLSVGWYGTPTALDVVQLDIWYKYDEVNRVLISQGWNIGGTVVADTTQNTTNPADRRSITLTYDAAGNRTTATSYGTKYILNQFGYSTASDYSTETYGYDGMGRLLTIAKDLAFATSTYVYDKASRQTQASTYTIESNALVGRVQTNTYNADGQVLSQSTTKSGNQESLVQFGTGSGDATGYSTYNATTGTWTDNWLAGYDKAGNVRGYTLKVYGSGGAYKYTSTYLSSFRRGEGYLQSGQTVTSTSGGPANNSTAKTYDLDLNVVKFTDTKDATLTRGFVYNLAGQVLTDVKGSFANDAAIATALTNTVAATNTGTWGRYFFENGENFGRAGALTNDDNVLRSNFDANYTKVKGTSVQQPTQVITVAGDTLRIVADRLWGDSSLWYVLADENGLADPDAEIVEGTVLTVPNQILAVSNNASTFKPFDLTAAIGDTTPIAKFPPPKKGGCGIIGLIIVIIVMIVVTIFTAGTMTAPVGSGLMATMSAGATAMAGGITAAGLGLTATGAMVAGAVGSIASQVVGLALGVQDSFSWKQVALSAIGSAVSVGMAGTTSLAGESSHLFGSSYVEIGARAAVGNALTQGIGVITGLQDSFDWRSVAASAISAPLAVGAMKNVVGPMLGPQPNVFAEKLGSSLTGGLTSAAVQAALGGKVNMVSVLTDAFATAVGNSLVDAMSAPHVAVTSLDSDEALSNRLSAQAAADLAGTPAPALDQNPDDFLGPIDVTAQRMIERYTARPGDSISRIVGSSNPIAIEAFMRRNGLTSSTIVAGREYVMPGPADYAASDGQLGQATLNADNVRLAARAAAAEAPIAGTFSGDREIARRLGVGPDELLAARSDLSASRGTSAGESLAPGGHSRVATYDSAVAAFHDNLSTQSTAIEGQALLRATQGSGPRIDGMTSMRPDGSYVTYKDGEFWQVPSDLGAKFMENQQLDWAAIDAAHDRMPIVPDLSRKDILLGASVLVGGTEMVAIGLGRYALASSLGGAAAGVTFASVVNAVTEGAPASEVGEELTGDAILYKAEKAAENLAHVGGSGGYWPAVVGANVLWSLRDSIQGIPISPSTQTYPNGVPRVAPGVDHSTWLNSQGFNPVIADWLKSPGK